MKLNQKIIAQEAKIKELSEKYFNLLDDYKKLKQSSIKFRVTRKLDRVFSAIYAILDSSDNGTSLTHKIALFFKTMFKWALSGFKLEEAQTQVARLEICKHCPELIKPNMQCRLCGCLMKNKVKIAGASCPLAKW